MINVFIVDQINAQTNQYATMIESSYTSFTLIPIVSEAPGNYRFIQLPFVWVYT